MTETMEDTKQSRVGKQPIAIPKGVTVAVQDREVVVKGPKGELHYTLPGGVAIDQKDGVLVVAPAKGGGTAARQFQGLTRALLSNAIVGVSEGYKKSLDLYGVGYRAELKGQSLTLSLGLSHQVKYELPKGLKVAVEIIDEAGTKRPRLHLESHDKQLLGQAAARLRSYRPPEPYKGKGVRYTGEKIREKAGKAAAK